jgi:hypothetical protein
MRTAIVCAAVFGMGVFAGCTSAGPAPDAPATPPAPASLALFNGTSLDGWDLLKCEAEVKDGAILLKAGNGIVQTKEQYADYVLELEWKALTVGAFYDSGIYLRYTSIPQNAPWPKNYQLNLTRGQEGNIPGIKAASSTGLVKEGEWNRFKATVKGTTIALEINGKPAWEVDELKEPKGFIGLQAEVPRGGQFLFRNIRLTKLGG